MSSFLNTSSDFFQKPTQWINDNFPPVVDESQAAAIKADFATSLGSMVQTISSLVAVPFQLIATLFSVLYYRSIGDFDTADAAWNTGISTTWAHLGFVVSMPVCSAISLIAGTTVLVQALWQALPSCPQAPRQRLA